MIVKLKRTACSILPLVLKGKWFDLIERGEKSEEYRDWKSWQKRITKWLHMFCKDKDHLVVAFQRGYKKPSMWFEVNCVCSELAIGHKSHPEWGEPSTPHYVIKLGKRIELTDDEIAPLEPKPKLSAQP